jgi:hypothetical protein
MSLADHARSLLRERIRANLLIEPDGSINLTARAWLCAVHVRLVTATGKRRPSDL